MQSAKWQPFYLGLNWLMFYAIGMLHVWLICEAAISRMALDELLKAPYVYMIDIYTFCSLNL